MFCCCQLHYKLSIPIEMCTRMQTVQKYLRFGADPNEFRKEVSCGLNGVRVGTVGKADELLLVASGKHIRHELNHI